MSLRFQQRLQVTANLQGVAIRGRVDKENIHLRGGVPGKNADCCHIMNQPAKRFLAPDQTNARAASAVCPRGGFFRLPTKGRYFITVKIQRPDAPPPGEARFEFDRY